MLESPLVARASLFTSFGDAYLRAAILYVAWNPVRAKKLPRRKNIPG